MRAAVSAALIVATMSPVYADSLRATLGEPVREVSHSVDVRVERGVASLKVRRTFSNGGARHDEAHLLLKMPPGAAATGLRIRSAKRWYSGELMRASKARAMYEKLTGLGSARPKDPALLQWRWADELELFLFPIAPKSTATVEYTLTMPTDYQNGVYYLAYPRNSGDKRLATPTFRIKAAFGASVRIDDREVAANEPTLGPPPSPILAKFGLDDSASHVASTLVPSWRWARKFGHPTKATVKVDIRHTYRGDLRVMLISPWNERILLSAREGGKTNDLRLEKELTLAADQGQSAAGQWHLVVSDFANMDVGTLRGWSIKLDNPEYSGDRAQTDSPRALPDAPARAGQGGMHQIAVPGPRIRTMAARLGRVALIAKKHFLRVELDMAPKLRTLPRKVQVVFVMDVSRSQDEDEVRAQLELVRGYLQHVPDADFAIVGYARKVRTLVDFQPATSADDIISDLLHDKSLALANGSSLDLALARAHDLVRKRVGPRRIVALTDGLLRPSWANRDAIAKISRGAGSPIIHVVSHDPDGAPSSERDDGDSLAAIARHTGGVFQDVSGLSEEHRKEIPRAVLSLVRPVRIDNVTHDGPVELALPNSLEEGASIREMLEVPRSRASLTIRGEIWSKPYRRTIGSRKWFNRVTAGLLFPADMYWNLSEDEQYKVAMYGRAVSPQTSYLAIEPGVRPSTAGIERLRARRQRPPQVMIGSASARGGRHHRDWASYFRAGVQECRRKHKSATGVTLTIDTTKKEIVAVSVAGPKTPLTACATEAAWAVSLPHYNRKIDQHVIKL